MRKRTAQYRVRATAHGCSFDFERVVLRVDAMAAVRDMARWLDREGWRPKRVWSENIEDAHDCAEKTYDDTADLQVAR